MSFDLGDALRRKSARTLKLLAKRRGRPRQLA
jgi:hypothetical protein